MAEKLHRAGDQVTDRYKVIEYLGEGGMQEVYKATDKTLLRVVALKVPKTKSAKKRFRRSAEVSAKVNHPNVAKTLDFFDIKGTNYLIEQLILGQDLGSRMKADFQKLDPHLAAHVIHHIAKGTSASHRANVFHRDLKPNNIMVSDDPGLDIVKITDFGIAKMAQAEIDESIAGGEESITASTTVVGALPYMAPELIQRGNSASLAADIWAVGAMLYHFLVGEPPFGTGLVAVPNILAGKLPNQQEVLFAPQHFTPLVSELWDIITQCLRVDPTKRLTATKLCEHLAKLPYSVAPRKTGVITDYRSGSGSWGFIAADDGNTCFFHLNSYYGNKPKVGTRVSFAPFPGKPYPRAFPVLPLRPAIPKDRT